MLCGVLWGVLWGPPPDRSRASERKEEREERLLLGELEDAARGPFVKGAVEGARLGVRKERIVRDGLQTACKSGVQTFCVLSVKAGLIGEN